jgi:hypothetical protein
MARETVIFERPNSRAISARVTLIPFYAEIRPVAAIVNEK